MITYEVWSAVQQRLLKDPGYLGVRYDGEPALVLCWRPGHTPGETAASASATLHDAGFPVRSEVNAVASTDVVFDLRPTWRGGQM